MLIDGYSPMPDIQPELRAQARLEQSTLGQEKFFLKLQII
jgi:hypothetical protein